MSFEEVYCWKCGKPLYSEISRRKGIGPICLAKMRAQYPHLTSIFALDR